MPPCRSLAVRKLRIAFPLPRTCGLAARDHPAESERDERHLSAPILSTRSSPTSKIPSSRSRHASHRLPTMTVNAIERNRGGKIGGERVWAKSGRGRQTLLRISAGRATWLPRVMFGCCHRNVPFYHAGVLGCPRSRCHENGRIFSPEGEKARARHVCVREDGREGG